MMINGTTTLVTIGNANTTTAGLTNATTSLTEENLWTASVLPWALTTPWTYDTPVFINTVQITNL